jgi:hypothetical protein
MAAKRSSKTLKKNREFWPRKYYTGLTRKQKIQRKKEIDQHKTRYHWSNPKAYTPFKTNKLQKTKKRSQYTVAWEKLFPDAKSIAERSKVTGVPEKYLKEVFNRGSAAWLTGHRPGQTTQSWSYPRMSSFLLCGKTHYTADADIVKKAKAESASARKWFKRCPSTQPKTF